MFRIKILGMIIVLTGAAVLTAVCCARADEDSKALEVMIEGQNRTKPLVDKLKLDMDQFRLFQMRTDFDDEVMDVSPPARDLLRDNPDKLSSEQVPSYGLLDIPSDELKVFKLDSGESAEKWEFSIVDSHGEELTDFKGKGSLPESLTLSLYKDKSRLDVKPGEIYSAMLMLSNGKKDKSTTLGDSFYIDCFMYECETGIVISLSSRSVFEGSTSGISPQGEQQLNKAADIMKEYRDFSYRVEVFSQDGWRGKNRVNKVKTYLVDRLIVPEKRIKTFQKTGPRYEYINIHILTKLE